jgi:hypothetical protein
MMLLQFSSVLTTADCADVGLALYVQNLKTAKGLGMTTVLISGRTFMEEGGRQEVHLHLIPNRLIANSWAS